MILHKDCLQFLLGLTMVPRENKNNAYAKFCILSIVSSFSWDLQWSQEKTKTTLKYAKFGWTNKEYYYNGIFRSGLFLCIFWQPMNNSATDFFKSGQHSARNSHVNQRICEWIMCINTLKVKNSKWRLLKGQRKDLLRKKYMFYTIILRSTIYRPDKTGQQIVPCKPAFIHLGQEKQCAEMFLV